MAYIIGSDGLGQAILGGLLERISDNVEYVGNNRVLYKQNISFVVDGSVYYGVKIRRSPAKHKDFGFETIRNMDDKGKVIETGWTKRNKAHLTAMIYRDHDEWVLYFFQAGEIIELTQDKKYKKRRIHKYGHTAELVYVPFTHLSHKQPVRIPIIGEPQTYEISQIHEYAKQYLTY